MTAAISRWGAAQPAAGAAPAAAVAAAAAAPCRPPPLPGSQPQALQQPATTAIALLLLAVYLLLHQRHLSYADVGLSYDRVRNAWGGGACGGAAAAAAPLGLLSPSGVNVGLLSLPEIKQHHSPPAPIPSPALPFCQRTHVLVDAGRDASGAVALRRLPGGALGFHPPGLQPVHPVEPRPGQAHQRPGTWVLPAHHGAALPAVPRGGWEARDNRCRGAVTVVRVGKRCAQHSTPPVLRCHLCRIVPPAVPCCVPLKSPSKSPPPPPPPPTHPDLRAAVPRAHRRPQAGAVPRRDGRGVQLRPVWLDDAAGHKAAGSSRAAGRARRRRVLCWVGRGLTFLPCPPSMNPLFQR
mgnify:CR=1 FL=1